LYKKNIAVKIGGVLKPIPNFFARKQRNIFISEQNAKKPMKLKKRLEGI
jgi:hypothetical protein